MLPHPLHLQALPRLEDFILSSSLKQPPGLQSLVEAQPATCIPISLTKLIFLANISKRSFQKQPCSLQSCTEVPVPHKSWRCTNISGQISSSLPTLAAPAAADSQAGRWKRWKTAGAADSAPAGTRGQGKLH